MSWTKDDRVSDMAEMRTGMVQLRNYLVLGYSMIDGAVGQQRRLAFHLLARRQKLQRRKFERLFARTVNYFPIRLVIFQISQTRQSLLCNTLLHLL